VLVVPVLAIALLACGGDDDGASTSAGKTNAFCARAEAIDRQFAELGTAFAGSDVPTTKVFDKAASALEDLSDSAPTAVRADLRTVASGVRKIAAALSGVDLSNRSALTDPKNAVHLEQVNQELEGVGKTVQAASDRVAKYLKDECGIETDLTTTVAPTTTLPATTTTLG
jgi:hypothetical protein